MEPSFNLEARSYISKFEASFCLITFYLCFHFKRVTAFAEVVSGCIDVDSVVLLLGRA